ncbi:transglutaminase family protein [Marinomonas piezotolerans]|uniref:Transglutaminase family protein n=1 Tax=Marinomonas piezotolerans TaxID=2213058 RepID=A0A370U961_9GAMM|nr:transglutaminase family protein [Marinomonas piezotolerans]RDL44305.1 transglutaminase family protein [Marinomonas piezotolerans]
MKYRVRHLTEYKYGSAVTLCYNMAHLLPRDTLNQICVNRRLHVTPTPIYQTESEDYFGNPTYYFSIQEPHKKLIIDMECVYDITPLERSQQLFLGSVTCGELRQLLAAAETPELRMTKEYLMDSPLIHRSSDLADYAAQTFDDTVPVLQAALDFTQKIFNEFTFDPTATSVSTPVEQVLLEKRGVCQDFAHLAIACIRSVGLPARYVSGYLETLPPPGQEKLVGADASHAWFAIYIPDMGWVEFDPTNNLMPSDQHIVTAWGRDYSDVTPLQGVIFDGGESQTIKVSVDVQRC